MTKNDLAREERIEKYDYFLGLFEDLVNKEKFRKILS